ncbi:MAG TPA: (2Fe-2S) ferredoxin domain-containing protein, partial [Paludibacter sp.]|nr:(2Fe-2S) ferredoxin domain-containing protein [Paludibacter sp.]
MKSNELEIIKQQNLWRIMPSTPMIMVGMGTCGIGNGADILYNKFQNKIKSNNFDCILKPVGCFGFCAEEPLVTVYQPGKPMLIYSKVDEKDADRIADGLFSGKIYLKKILCRIDAWDHLTSYLEYGKDYEHIPHWDDIPFYKGQKKIVLRNAGIIDPESIEDYIAI